MQKKSRRDSRAVGYAYMLAATLLIVFFAVALIPGSKSGTESSSEVAEGRTFLAELDAVSPEDLEAVKKEQQDARTQAERDTLIADLEAQKKALENEEVNVWGLFRDYAILGDSRAVGFFYYDFLSEDRVLADGGLTIRDIEEYMDRLITLNPSQVFLCFGLNDVSIGNWDTPEAYAEEYLEILNDMQERLPDTVIYVSSILPAQDQAFEKSSAWRNIPEYSAAVESMCAENGYSFINNDEIAAAHADMWDSDGIHLHPEFYPLWATNMMLAVYDYEEEQLLAQTDSEEE